MERSGIEEIDLVSEELARTGERMAGRLAAERQAAADAPTTLRTPLTALRCDWKRSNSSPPRKRCAQKLAPASNRSSA